MTSHTQRARDALKASAARRAAAYNGKTRIVVQIGHCSSSVDSVQVAEALASQAPDSAYIVTAGCDGDCYDAPRVVVTAPDGARSVFGGVTTKDARRILESTSLPKQNGATPPYAEKTPGPKQSHRASRRALDRCVFSCRALASMARSATRLCMLTGVDDIRCQSAQGRVRAARALVRRSCPACSH